MGEVPFSGPRRPPMRLGLWADESFFVGEFHCFPDDPEWSTPVTIGDGDHVVFPRSPVRIVQAGRGDLVATANHAVFYNSGQEYLREKVGPAGDHCLYVVVRRPVIEGLADACGVDAGAGAGSDPLPYVDGPLCGRLHLLQHALAGALRARPDPDPLMVEEAVFALVGGALTAAGRHHRGRPLRRRATERSRREIVEEIKARLAADLTEPASLVALAAAVHVSPFHLARVFRELTGFTVHRYRVELRLRAGLPLVSGGSDLRTVAIGGGFSSHSQYTRHFRSSFGVPPSTVKRAAEDREWDVLLRRLAA